MPEASLPLTGTRVVALVETVPGPLASAILADLGATVTVVERPGTGDPTRGVPAVFRTLGRNKRFVSLDLHRADHRDVLERLLGRAEVVITGYRPDVARRLGVDAGSLRRRHPQAVVVSMTAYGPDGPDAEKAAHDLSIQALAGLLPGDRPVRDGDLDGLPVTDLMTGTYGAIAALAGLLARRQTGSGSTLEVSMRDAAFALNAFAITAALQALPPTARLRAPAGYGTFETRDRQVMALAVSFESRHWERLCHLLGRRDLAELGIDRRIECRAELNGQLAEAIATFDADELQRRLTEAGLPFEWVLDVDDVVHTDGLRSAAERDQGGAVHLGSPIVVDGRRPPVTAAPDTAGAHTRAVLAELGYRRDAIDRLLTARAPETAADETNTTSDD